MHKSLTEMQSWLKSQYEDLGISWSFSPEQGVCTWRAVDEHHADVFDSQLGIWLRIIAMQNRENASEEVLGDVRSALEAVSSLDIRSGITAAHADELGAWQVHLLWLIPNGCKEAWEAAIRELRRRSAHSEEVGLDLIDISSKSLVDVLESEGIPCLLLRTRKLLLLTSKDLPEWKSPDSQFEEQLTKYISNIPQGEQREFASSVIARAKKPHDSVLSSNTVSTLKISNGDVMAVTDFRNVVSAEVPVNTDGASLVFFGPNGTGKSSIFEAICLGVFGSSARHREFLEDADLTARQKQEYARGVLARFGSSANAKVVIGGVETLAYLASSVDDSKSRLANASGAQRHNLHPTHRYAPGPRQTSSPCR